ncbi:MAG TPA: shikimate kinase [Bdellovibrionota bacterium]|nr:shikimate kinase [Bdellovibrionota bacterium]
MRIVLLGVKGVGKTTVGEKLAKALNLSFIDTDQVMEKLIKKRTCDIFLQKGEQLFREIERDVLSQVKANIIAVGGGTVLAEENRKILRSMGHLICLYMRKEEVLSRWKDWPSVCQNFDHYYEERMEALRSLPCTWVDATRLDLIPILLRVVCG